MPLFTLAQSFLGMLHSHLLFTLSAVAADDSWVLVFFRGEQEQHPQLQPGICHLFKCKQLPQLQQRSPAQPQLE